MPGRFHAIGRVAISLMAPARDYASATMPLQN
jgi:hypothetical protein